jgi:hypothetical protein
MRRLPVASPSNEIRRPEAPEDFLDTVMLRLQPKRWSAYFVAVP